MKKTFEQGSVSPCGSVPASVNATAPLFLLTRLAKRGARAELKIKSSGNREIRITTSLNGRSAHSQPKTEIPYGVFCCARDNGWLIDVDGLGIAWTISQEGLLALRRARACGEGNSHVVAAASRPEAQTESPPPLSVPHIDAAESPLGWLRSRRDKAGRPLISAVQFDAGERLRADIWFAQMSPRVTANWSATGASSTSGSGLGVDIRDNVAAAQQRVRRAMAAVGPISSGLLIDVCGHLLGLEQIERARGWPQRSGKIALQMALCELARHYGLPGTTRSALPQSAKVQHWGTPDYRPSFAAEPAASND